MPGLNLTTETDCWNALKNDDPRALGHLYDAYVDKLFLSAMLFSNDRELSKDAIQEVFIDIWTYRKSIGEVKNSQAYLTKILRRVLYKKQKIDRHLVYTLEPDSQLFSSDENAEQSHISADSETEKQTRLRVAIAELTKKQKQILELRFNQGLTYDQIASRLGMNYQSVNNLAFRTFRRLRGALTPFVFLIELVR